MAEPTHLPLFVMCDCCKAAMAERAVAVAGVPAGERRSIEVFACAECLTVCSNERCPGQPTHA